MPQNSTFLCFTTYFQQITLPSLFFSTPTSIYYIYIVRTRARKVKKNGGVSGKIRLFYFFKKCRKKFKKERKNVWQCKNKVVIYTSCREESEKRAKKELENKKTLKKLKKLLKSLKKCLTKANRLWYDIQAVAEEVTDRTVVRKKQIKNGIRKKWDFIWQTSKWKVISVNFSKYLNKVTLKASQQRDNKVRAVVAEESVTTLNN